MRRTIICRAKLSPNCLDGESTTRQFGAMERDGDPPMSRDQTFNGASIVCSPCYNTVLPYTPSGEGRLHELADATMEVRTTRRAVKAGTEEALKDMIAQADRDMRVASRYSYQHRLAREIKKLAVDELRSRQLADESIARRREELAEQERAEAEKAEQEAAEAETASEEAATA